MVDVTEVVVVIGVEVVVMVVDVVFVVVGVVVLFVELVFEVSVFSFEFLLDFDVVLLDVELVFVFSFELALGFDVEVLLVAEVVVTFDVEVFCDETVAKANTNKIILIKIKLLFIFFSLFFFNF